MNFSCRYGFRKDPVLSLNASPKVGTHEINLSAVVQMIEKKLIQEFKVSMLLICIFYLSMIGLAKNIVLLDVHVCITGLENLLWI